MIEITEPVGMRDWSRAARARGQRVSFVPTMGYLHEGHLRLVDLARDHGEAVVLSVFVNPLQFAEGEDIDRYPRDLDGDRAAAGRRRVALLFAPTAETIYPTRPIVRVVPGGLARHLCGPARPGHFEGVLTVVAKLFHIVEPDIAVFGRKDYQQATMIRRMALDLDMAVDIIVGPIVREPDGLALSSRNAYLDDRSRQAATVLPRGLEAVHHAHGSGEIRAGRLREIATGVMREEPDVHVEYLEVVSPEDLVPLEVAAADSIVAVAAHVGGARLIDNIVLGEGLQGDLRIAG